MNDTMIKRLSLLALGGVIGGIAGYFLGKLIIEKLEDRAREVEIEGILSTIKDEVVEEISERPPVPDPVKSGIRPKRAPRNYTDYSKKDKGDLEKLVAPYTSLKIGVISIREYIEDAKFEKVEMLYYEDDTTYCDATTEEIIDDPNGLFGPNAHLHFGEGSEDPDMVYVRNEKNGTDYEITRIRNAYSVVVLGEPKPEPKESKSARRRSARKVVEKNDDEEDIDEEE